MIASDLRELNELKFARFDAKLEQRLAELRSELVTRKEGLETRLERRLGEQTRWLLLAWATVLTGVVGLWVRG